MSDVAIRVDEIGKRYRIGMLDERPDTLAGAVGSVLRSPLQSFRNLRKLSTFEDDDAPDVVWALRDVTFEVKHGEAVGLIGRNGAGKSTLLKILSQITEPSTGRIELNGRVASLLEVGTGFHPELTGRENVFLNGAILGMTRVEVARKFDEIVAFSEIEKFIDTPVKRYSSGMRVRLAFAVAAHLEPEILLVDEVLAVGDVAFQRKCLGKMDEVAGEGRTVVFVSHHMSMIQALCTRGVLLDNGQIEFDGGVNEAVLQYLNQVDATAKDPFGENAHRSGNGLLRLTAAAIHNAGGNITKEVVAGEAVSIAFEYYNPNGVRRFDVVFTIYDGFGTALTNVDFGLNGFLIEEPAESGRAVCHLHRLPLVPGSYRIAAAIRVNGAVVDHVPAALRFDVASSVFYDSGSTPPAKFASFMLEHAWEYEPLEYKWPNGTTVGYAQEH